MPIEVIDLLSSPALPPVIPSRRLQETDYKTTSRVSPQKPALSTATSSINLGSTVLQTKKGKDEWYTLSDDDDRGLSLQQVTSCHSAPNANVTATLNTSSNNLANESRNESNGRSYDYETQLDYGTDPFASSNPLPPIEADRTTAAVKTSAKGSVDYVILSDDFESTINLDTSYSWESSNRLRGNKRQRTPEQDIGKVNLPRLKDAGIRRIVSDVTSMSSKPALKVKYTGLKRAKTSVMEEDEILFTSSPDLVRVARDRRERARRQREQEENLDGDEVDLNDNIPVEASRRGQISLLYGTSSDSELPDLETMASQVSASRVPRLSREDSNKVLADYNSKKAAAQKAKEKAVAAQKKLEAKEAEKERKRLLKEGKTREKLNAADLEKVNRVRTDKKVSTPEMIVDLSVNLDERLLRQTRQFLQPLDVECKEWTSPIPNVVKWRRKVEASYNEDLGHWEPAPKRVTDEKHVLCHILAQEFIALTTGDEGQDLDAHVLTMKAKFPKCSLIYLIEGLTPWMRKNKNIRNRQFTEAVRNQMAPGDQASQRPKKQKPPQEYIDEDMVEDALLRLQVMHGALIHHTTAMVDSAQWISAFTQHISTVPYRQQKMLLDTAFCMESGQVKTGDSASDTYIKMLQEINRITASHAYGIASEYPSAQQLVKGFEKHGKDMLQSIRKSMNKDGAFSDKEIGKKVSNRIYDIFMGTDEGSTDV